MTIEHDVPTIAELKRIDTLIQQLRSAKKAKTAYDLALMLMAIGDKFRQLETNLNFRIMF